MDKRRFCVILGWLGVVWGSLGSLAWGDDLSAKIDPKTLKNLASLEHLLQRVTEKWPGAHVLQVELEDSDSESEEEHAELVYEVKILTADGRVIKLDYRATDLLLLKQRLPKQAPLDD